MNNMEKAVPIATSKVVVLVCPPLTKKKFNRDRLRGRFSFFFLKKKEFIQEQLNYFPTWRDYEEHVVLKVVKYLFRIKNVHHADVFYDISFSKFKKIVELRKYDVVFLVAHHIESETRELGLIEFADGGISIDEFSDVIKKNFSGISLVLFVCKMGMFKHQIHSELETIATVVASYWRMELLKGVEFLEIWISFFDGKTILFDAYSKAIRKFTKTDEIL